MVSLFPPDSDSIQLKVLLKRGVFLTAAACLCITQLGLGNVLREVNSKWRSSIKVLKKKNCWSHLEWNSVFQTGSITCVKQGSICHRLLFRLPCQSLCVSDIVAGLLWSKMDLQTYCFFCFCFSMNYAGILCCKFTSDWFSTDALVLHAGPD